MYDRCKMCNKQIQSTDDCKLLLSGSGRIEAFCLDCYVKKKETK